MATPAEDTKPSYTMSEQATEHLQHLQTRVARRRLSQARHRATLAGLFNNLRKTVYSQSDLTASKWQVLNKATVHIQELEQSLDNLLKLKESFHLEDGNPNSLEEVKKEYARMYSGNDRDAEEGENEDEGEEEEDQEEEEEEEEEEEKKEDLSHSQATASPDILEFERYLSFYKQMMDLLASKRVVSPQEATLPVVSLAISHLWHTLPEEKKASLLQTWKEQRPSSLPDLTEACMELECVEDSVKDSGVESQGASGSLGSTQEEMLFEDAFDVASFLDKNEAPSISSLGSLFVNCNSENTEEKFQLFTKIMDFFKGLGTANAPSNQEPAPPVDDEMLLLKCLETFDDDL